MPRYLRIFLIPAFLFSLCAFAKMGLVKTAEITQLEVYGTVTKTDDKAVVVSGTKKYTLPWRKFITLNDIPTEHEKRQAKYKIPHDKDLKIEFEPSSKDPR